MNRIRLSALLAALVVALFLGASFVFVLLTKSDDQFAACRRSKVTGNASIGGPFTLVDSTGKTVTDVDVITKPSLVYFGYTFCPDVCPLDVSRNAEAVDLLMDMGHDVRPVFITIDPDRDTPEVLAEYTGYMHPEMIGLTGSGEQIKAASRAYRTYYRRQDNVDEDYLMDHSAFTYLVLPETGFATFFSRSVPALDMATQTACYVRASG